jgi:glutamate dehydrogenase (NAD(P)+)
MEQICRRWVRYLAPNLGPKRDIPAPDMMASAQYMLWMLDEYEAMQNERCPGFISGKPEYMFGAKGRRESTGFGAIFTVRELLKELNLPIDKTKASIQGFGAVGQSAFKLYQTMGGSVVSVSCWNQKENQSLTYFSPDGLDYRQLIKITDRFGDIDQTKARQSGLEVLPGDDWIAQEVDILIPAAIENQITKENVARIKPTVKVIVEGANGPTTPEADEVIKDSDITIIPDLLANAGGSICSYFEQVQSNQNYYWESSEVFSKLDIKMTSAFTSVSELAHKQGLSMREAAQLIAVERVASACRDRGWA